MMPAHNWGLDFVMSEKNMAPTVNLSGTPTQVEAPQLESAIDNATQATNDNTAATEEQTKYEPHLTDWIEVWLNTFTRKVDQIANKISDWITITQKQNLLKQQVAAVDAELNANRQAYKKYIEEANKVGLSGTYKAKVQNGELSIEDIQDEDLRDKITQYQDLYEKAKSCQDAIQDLANSEVDLYEQIASIPAEKAEKTISKLENASNRYQAVYDSVSQGKSTSTLLNKQIDADAKKYGTDKNTAQTKFQQNFKNGKNATYYAQGGNLIKQLNLARLENDARQKELKETQAIVKQYTADLKGLKKGTEEYSIASQKLAIANEKLAESQTAANEAQNKYVAMITANQEERFGNVKDFYENRTEYYDSIASSAEAKRNLEQARGVTLDKSSYKDQMDALKSIQKNQATEVKKLTQQLKTAEKNGIIPYSEEWNRLMVQLNGAQTDLYNTQISIINLKDEMNNVDKSGTVFDWVEKRLDKLAKKTQKYSDQITDWITFNRKGSLQKNEYNSMAAEIEANQKAYDRYMQEANAAGLSWQWRKLVQSGDYDISRIQDQKLVDKIQEYETWYQKAMECKNAIDSLTNSQLELYNSMMQLPLEKAGDSVDKYNQKISQLSSTSDTVRGASTQAILLDQIKKSGAITESQKLLEKYATEYDPYSKRQGYNPYSVQNAQLAEEKKYYESIAKARLDAYKQAQKNLDETKKQTAAMEDRVVAAQMVVMAEEAVAQAQNDLVEAQNNYAAKVIELEAKRFENIKSYFDSYTDYYESIAQNAEAARELAINQSKPLTASSFDDQLAAMQQIQSNQAKEVERLTAQIKAAEKRSLVPYSQEWNELVIQLNGAQSALANTKKEIIDIKYEMETAYRTGTMFDWIEQRLEVLEKKTKSFAQRITNWANSSLKGSLLTSEYSSITAQIEGNQRAYERYMEEANKVTLSNAWKQRVQNGEYDINYITDPHLADRIQTYQEWYDKAVACKDAVTNLKYEQLDLYNTIMNHPLEKAAKQVEEYNKSIGHLSSVLNVLNSGESASKFFDVQVKRSGELEEAEKIFKANYNTALMHTQQNRELEAQKKYYKQIVDQYLVAYNTAQKNLETTKAQAATDKDKEIAAQRVTIAQEALNTAMNNLLEAQVNYATKVIDIEKQKFENVKNYYGGLVEYEQTLNSIEEKEIDLYEARGNYERSVDYNKLIENRKDEFTLLKQQLSAMQNYLRDAVKLGNIVEDSAEYKEMNSQIVNITGSVKDMEIEIMNLIQQQNRLRYEELFERAAKSAANYIDRLETINDLITDEMMFSDRGELTDAGALRLILDAKQLDKNIENLKRYIQERQKIYDQYNAGWFGKETFDEMMEENQSNLNNYLNAANSTRQAILDVVKDQAQEELNYINKLIDARKELWQQKKEYYDYDKQLGSKTKEIKLLEQQARALQNVAGEEAKAQRARLNAQLQERNEDLEDTVRNHIYELQVKGLDDLSEQLQENYEDFIKEISSDLDKMSKVITEAISNSDKNRADALKFMSDLFSKQFDVNVNSIPKYTTQYASGTKRVPMNMTALTQEDGSEIIVTKNGILTPLKKGDGVIPHDLTENLYDLARIYPDIKQMLAGDAKPVAVKNTNQTIAPVINTEFVINGSGLSKEEVADVVNGYIPKISRTVQNDIRKDLKKSGR